MQGEIQEKLLNQNKQEEKQIANMLANKYGSKTENNNIAIKNQQGQVSNLFIDENTSSNELQREWRRNEQLSNRMENISSEIIKNGNNGQNNEHVNEFNGYTQKEIDNIESNKIAIARNENDILKFVDNSKKFPSNARLYLSKVSNRVSDFINNKLGININNYNISLKTDDVRKIFKDHGTEKTEIPRGQVPITNEDFKNIPNIINNPDCISKSGESAQGKPAIKFEKILMVIQ